MYLNADMSLEAPVHMRLDSTMTDLILDIDPKYSEYTDARGGVTVHLKKALYGCVESSGLRYKNLYATMLGLGYIRNICVFNRTGPDGHQCTVAVHVYGLNRGLGRRNESWLDGERKAEGRRKATLLGQRCDYRLQLKNR